MYIKHVIFQSTRPSRASTFQPGSSPGTKKISIHKALAGLDAKLEEHEKRVSISIHKALAGLDVDVLTDAQVDYRFQSTRPSRASTPYHVGYRPG